MSSRFNLKLSINLLVIGLILCAQNAFAQPEDHYLTESQIKQLQTALGDTFYDSRHDLNAALENQDLHNLLKDEHNRLKPFPYLGGVEAHFEGNNMYQVSPEYAMMVQFSSHYSELPETQEDSVAKFSHNDEQFKFAKIFFSPEDIKAITKAVDGKVIRIPKLHTSSILQPDLQETLNDFYPELGTRHMGEFDAPNQFYSPQIRVIRLDANHRLVIKAVEDHYPPKWNSKYTLNIIKKDPLSFGKDIF